MWCCSVLSHWPEGIGLGSVVSSLLLRLCSVLHSAGRWSSLRLPPLLLLLLLFDLQQTPARIRHHAVLQARQLPVCDAAGKKKKTEVKLRTDGWICSYIKTSLWKTPESQMLMKFMFLDPKFSFFKSGDTTVHQILTFWSVRQPVCDA